jgi:hypothetical protein
MTLHTENSEKWKNLASIDYFTHFIKAWIPFNAWYKKYYPTLETDRKAIDEIKARPNSFRNKLVSLLESQDNVGVAFKSRIAELHQDLESKYIFHRDERITFEKIKIEDNPKTENSFSRNACKYEVKRGMPNRRREIDIFIYDKHDRVKFSYTQTDGFNLGDLITNSNFLKLPEPQQINLKVCYEDINPSKPINLLIQDPDLLKEIKDEKEKSKKERNSKPTKYIEMGNFFFVNNSDHLCKGIIEILYKLRNVLFHGEIVPDSETNKIYESAYQILYTLIQAL